MLRTAHLKHHLSVVLGLIALVMGLAIFIIAPSVMAGGGPAPEVMYAQENANYDWPVQEQPMSSYRAVFSIQLLAGTFKNTDQCKVELDEGRTGAPTRQVGPGLFSVNPAPGEPVAWARATCEPGKDSTVRPIEGTGQSNYALAGAPYTAILERPTPTPTAVTPVPTTGEVALWWNNANLDWELRSQPSIKRFIFSAQILGGFYNNPGNCRLDLDNERDGSTVEVKPGMFSVSPAPGEPVAWLRITCEPGKSATVRLVSGISQQDYALAGKWYVGVGEDVVSPPPPTKTRIHLPLVMRQLGAAEVRIGPAQVNVEPGQEFTVNVSLSRAMEPGETRVTAQVTWQAEGDAVLEAIGSTELSFEAGQATSQPIKFSAKSAGKVRIYIDKIVSGNASKGVGETLVTIGKPCSGQPTLRLGPPTVSTTVGGQFMIDVNVEGVVCERTVIQVTWEGKGGGIDKMSSTELVFQPGSGKQQITFKGTAKGNVEIRFDKLVSGSAILADTKPMVTIR